MKTSCVVTTVANSGEVTIKSGFDGTLVLPAWLQTATATLEVRGFDKATSKLFVYPYPTVAGDQQATLVSEYTPRCAIPIMQSPKDDDYFYELAYKLDALLSSKNPQALPVYREIPTPMYTEGTFKWFSSMGKTQILGANTHWLQLKDKLPNLLFKRSGDTYVYEVASIESDTQLTLREPYLYEGEIPIEMYHEDMYYQEQSVLFFGGALWRNTVSQTVSSKPPAPFYSPETVYNNGVVVYDPWERKFYRNISGGALTGTPLTSTAWQNIPVSEVRSNAWLLDDSETYQLCYNLTPNLKLPLLATQDTDQVSWARYIFRKAFAAV